MIPIPIHNSTEHNYYKTLANNSIGLPIHKTSHYWHINTYSKSAYVG